MTIGYQRQGKRHYLRPVITLAYLALVIYGSLYPLSDWRIPADDNWLALFDVTAKYMPRSDYITNVLVYMPLGLLLTVSLRSRFRKKHRVIPAVIGASAVLSLALEWLQVFLPRVPSLIDWALNIVGASLGSLIAFFTGKYSRSGMLLREWRYRWFTHGRFADLGLVILAVWALHILSPLAPITDLGQIGDKLVFYNPKNQWVIYANIVISTVTVGFLISFISVTHQSFWKTFLGFTFLIFSLRLFVADVSMDLLFWVFGLFGIVALWGLQRLEMGKQAIVVLGLLTISYLVTHSWEMGPHSGTEQVINWLPFDRQIGKVHRFGEILYVFFVFLTLSFCAIAIQPQNDFNFGMIGGFVVVTGVLFLETQSTQIDMTEVLLALGAWTIPWIHPEIRKGPRRR